MLRDWVKTLPLSGEDAAVGLQSAADTGKVRVAFVQFSGTFSGTPISVVKGSSQKTPSGVGSAGRLTGKMDQLDADLDWHETNYMMSGTFIAEGLHTAGSILSQSPVDGRRRVLIIITDGKIQDSNLIGPAQQVLAGEKAEIFGIVVRRFDAVTQSDKDAEGTLKPITSNPQVDHFYSLPMDKFATDESPLHGICDPDTVWGKAIARTPQAGVHQPCPKYTGKQMCGTDEGCAWDDALSACSDSKCVLHCTESDCLADTENKCAIWDDAKKVCRRAKTCPQTSEPTCNADKGCQWKDPGVCVERDCKHDGEASCIGDTENECQWDAVGEECTVKPCVNLQDTVACSGDPECEWSANATPPTCMPGKCKQTEKDKCIADPNCDWEGGCKQRPCTQHPDDKTCDGDPICHWSTKSSPGTCQLKHCAKFDETQCEVDAGCIFDKNVGKAPGTCVEKICSKITVERYGVDTACECLRDPGCYWGVPGGVGTCMEQQFGRCPTLDVVILFDGSGSMSQDFGRHPVGFYAQMEMLRDWVKTLPLSGEDAAVGLQSAADTGKVRVAFVQFSGTFSGTPISVVKGSSQKTPSGVGSAGRLTGKMDQLDADLDWHETNYMMSGTFIAEGLHTAGSILSQSPVDGRRRVLIIITDGKIQDTHLIGPAQKTLESEQVTIFGVVIRRTDAITSSDLEAEKALKPIVSQPQDVHFSNLPMDKFATDEGPLSTLCDPLSDWGKDIAIAPRAGVHQPCSKYTVKSDCNMDAGCLWSDGLLRCADSKCVLHCTEGDCLADTANGCKKWDTQALTCYREPSCTETTEASCNASPKECQWKDGECKDGVCKHDSEAGCLADTEAECEWISVDNKCQEKPCVKNKDENTCNAVTTPLKCHWEKTAHPPACMVDKCQYPDELHCKSDPQCIWDKENGKVCKKRPCVDYADDNSCNHDPECHWSTAASPGSCQQRHCAKFTEQTCEVDPKCIWDKDKAKKDGSKGMCVDKECNMITKEKYGPETHCECIRDPDCYWGVPGGVGTCMEQSYGTCPTMDIVVVFDGSGSMSQTFGRHTHGFYAMMEMLRDWVKSLPLSGEKAGAPSSPTEKVRVAMIQFSGKTSSTGPTGGVVNSAIKTPSGTGTGGRLSGDLSEVDKDIDWHENNYLMEDTYIEEGLSMAVGIFRGSPTDGRKRLLIILTDGKIKDADRLAKSRAELDGEQVIVFGIVLRRFAAHTALDEDAEKVLKTIVSEPPQEHFANLEIDEVPTEVLQGLCDPTSKWGKYVVPASGTLGGVMLPCPNYKDKVSCIGDKGCSYSDSVLACVDTPCLRHCHEDDCNADTDNECYYEPDKQACYRKPRCAYTTGPSCSRDAECKWVNNSVCTVKPCVYSSEDSCIADPAGCEWDGTCREKPCVGITVEQVCKDADECEWKDGKCTERRCTICNVKVDPQTCCENDQVFCDYTGGRCSIRPCVHLTTEKECARENDECKWDSSTAPAACVQRYCAKFDSKEKCNLEAKCAWDWGLCAEKLCSDYEKVDKPACACNTDPTCYWHDNICVDANYGACPTMDIVVMLPGAASMSQVFGRHPIGYEAVIEMLREWSRRLPLAGDIGRAGLDTDISVQPAMKGHARLGFIQFSGDKRTRDANGKVANSAVKTASIGTQGRLSGYMPQITQDLEWMDNNQLKQDTFLESGLSMASGMFQSLSPNDGRKKVLIIMANEKVGDTDRLGDELSGLVAMQVHVMGIVLRRFDQYTTGDQEADNTLKPLVSEPKHLHFGNYKMDDVRTNVFDVFCNPESRWGAWLVDHLDPNHQPCAFYADLNDCGKDEGCQWDDTSRLCTTSPCLKICNENNCKGADPTLDCVWKPKPGQTGNNSEGLCKKRPVCGYDTPAECAKEEKCRWNQATVRCEKKPCIHDTEDSCNADTVGCDWIQDTSTCQEKECNYKDSATCNGDKDCKWKEEGVVATCIKKECTAPTQAECEKSPLCLWDTKASPVVCKLKPCAEHIDEAECNKDLQCEWTTRNSPAYCQQTYCARWGDAEADCNGDPVCTYIKDPSAVCIEKTCDVFKQDKCACNADTECFWSDAQSACVNANFGACPATDLIVTFDGSSTMAQSFGRHPHGFEAVMEIIGKWVNKLPLNGDSYLKTAERQNGQPVATAGGMRVGLVQFSAEHEAKKTQPPTGTGGQLSGKRQELIDDIDFHEHYQLGDKTYINPALTFVNSMFQNSPQDRQRILIVISDGPLLDGQDLGVARKNLESQQVQTFGIALRRFDSKTSADVDTEQSLQEIVSAPHADHWAAIQVHELEELLTGLCNPNTRFGKSIAAKAKGDNKPCGLYTDVVQCYSDKGCKYDESTLTCVTSPCLQWCKEADCNADSKNQCKYDAADQTCWRRPVCEDPDEAKCKEDAMCAFEPASKKCKIRKCYHGGEASCLADPEGCDWDAATLKCSEEPCTNVPKATCEGAAWCPEGTSDCANSPDKVTCTLVNTGLGNATKEVCIPKVDCAEKKTKDVCTQDRTCEWFQYDLGCAACYRCRNSYCGKYQDELTCNKDDKCDWDTSTSPAACVTEPCLRYQDKTSCDAEPSGLCAWNEKASPPGCDEKKCSNYDSPCPCNQDLSCFWKTDKCLPMAFAGCPKLDLVMAFEASPAMAVSYGRHPHGYYGLIEKFRKWTKQMSLTGESALTQGAADSDGVRLAFLQYGQQAVKAAPDTGAAGGKLSGVAAELLMDLDWHESHKQSSTKVEAAGAFETAAQVFASTPFGRKKVFVIVGNSAPEDVGQRIASAQRMLGQDVSVFGVQVRRFTAFTDSDKKAKDALRPLVTTVAEDHLVSLEIDTFADQVLAGICSPTNLFGSQIAVAMDTKTEDQPCGMYIAKNTCNADNKCAWNDRLITCSSSGCLHYCTEADCTADKVNNCKWKADTSECVRQVQCDYSDASKCTADPGCEWVTDPKTICKTKDCQYTSEEGCTEDPVGCVWFDDSKVCRVRPCRYTSSGACNAASNCVWDDSILSTGEFDKCNEKPCLHPDQPKCTADQKCMWKDNKCDVKSGCVAYLDERACDHDYNCHWNVDASPSYCDLKYCKKKKDQPTCDADKKCKWDAAENTCKENSCSGYDKACKCTEDPLCYWDVEHGVGHCVEASFGGCPVMDVVIVFDGSGSMSQSFGRHPNGYYGLIEALRDWTKHIPMTNEPAGTESTAAKGGVRIGLVQFSAEGEARKSPSGVGSAGRLSGMQSEISADLDWHENNFIMSSTFIMQALEYAADMFRTSPAGRKRVLLIITDGKIQDAAQIGNARSTLTVLGVQTFGVVIRRLESHTQTDIDAEETLRAIVSEDRDDHLMNVALDGFAQDVLGDFCNPTGKFGKLIAGFDPHEAAKQHKHLPCELYTDQRDCEADSGCVFNQKTLLCTKSKCQVQCSDGECTGFAEETCKWAGDVCYRKPVCDAEEQSPCEAQTYTNKEGNPENCYWYSNDICGLRPCTAKEEDGCRADPYYCEWDDSLGAAGECKVNPCKPVLPEEDCNKLPTCAYNKKMQQCVKKHCVYDEEKCKKHAFACDWDGTTCKPKPCAAHDEEAVCSDDPDCEWTVDHSPGYCVKKKCRTYDGKDECTTGDGANWACDWNEQDKACDEGRDLCTNRTSECTCKQTPGCLWDVDRCFASSFSTCPVMDVVMLFTGANSMQLEFGRHPNGYFGMMEIMADWVRHLPLTGERVGDPPKKQTATSGVRVGLVQFSDKGAARRTPTTVPNAAAGSITGSIDQANIDLKWHEWNPAKGDNYIAQGMSFASIMFKQTPADRKKVLMIITDSEIPEISRLTASRAALDSMRVETFGVLLRRFTTVMPDDEKAASSLKPLTSEPTDAHFQSITLGEFGKLLYGICDENTPFGYYIGAHGEPRHQHCPDYKVQRDCFLDTLCAWKNNLCIPSDCPDNCDEGSCAGKKDQDGGCEWDATDKACAGALCGGTDKETCEKDALCYWEISEQKCSPKAGCQSIPCDIFDMECIKHTTCDESPLGCKWDMGNNICTDTRACMIYKGKAECQTNTKCQWNSALNTCEDKNGCALYNAQEPCGQDKNCMWDTENTICVDRSCGVYKSEVTCTGDPLCTWNATQCKDKGDCASLTTATDAQAKCIADDRCDWVADNSTCVKKPTQTGCRRHAEQNPCDDDIACQWNGAKSQCEDSTECVTHTDSTACLANNCEWFDKPLVSTALCGKRCASNTAQTPCDAQTTCDWDGNKCVTKDPCTMPSLRNDEAECNNLIVCQYKNASGCAKVNCAAISPGGGNSSGGCDAEPKCETKGSMCVQKDNCPFFKDQNNCECGVATNCDKTCAYDTPNKQCAKIKDKCNVYNQAECDQQEACTWDTAAAPAVCKTKCSCTAGGECVAAGADKCCACNAGFTGADCSTCLGAVVNGKCLQCSRELTCSNHGDCDRDTSACICDIGWTGPDCSVQSCAPVGPWWFTTFPNRPQVSQMFSVIVHGCFDKPDDLRVIPKTTAGTDNTCAGFNADFAGGNLDTDDCRGKTGTPMIRDDKCKAIQPTATVEPQSRMELLINMTANWNSGEEETKEYVVCWKKSDGNWEPIKTHDRDGKTRDTLLVLSKPGDDAGSDMRGAATGEQGTYEECCEGLKFGEACLPTALVFILWALLIALIAKLVYDVIQSRKEKNELSAKSAKYADVDMEGGHEALNK
eukprot:TRINITY_DN96_c0_g1_i2.p1 TRINITY_DN96_c0_g1~~TRINITY_DN96_c0_g1_i2.p1  ORF type:complete len:4651 (+),score=1821.07 TRINITY_DN96_c0_g1_i2:2-13954(+)